MYTSNNEFDVNRSELNVESDTLTELDGISVFCYSENNWSSSQLIRIVNQIKPQVVYHNSVLLFRYGIVPHHLTLFGKMNCDEIISAPRGTIQVEALQLKSRKKKLAL